MITNLPPGFRTCGAASALSSVSQVVQFTVHQNSECLESLRRRMNPPLSLVHWPGRGRYHLRQLCGGVNRPRPNNGSGDSPRPPFLTEFVNRVGKLALVEAVYHLFGGQPRLRIHPHIQGPVCLKTKSALCVLQLHGADTQVGKQSVHRGCRHMLRHFGKRRMHQLDLRPVACQLRWRLASAARAPVPTLPGPYRSQSNDLVRPGVLRFPNCVRLSPGSRRYRSRRAVRPGIRSLVLKELAHG